MDLEETIRTLVRKEFSTDIRMTLAQIARRTEVDYKRLWSFMQDENPGRLSAVEAQRIYEGLTQKPLLPESHGN